MDEPRTNADLMPKGLKPSLWAGAFRSRPGSPRAGPGFSYCSGGGRGEAGAAFTSGQVPSNPRAESRAEHTPSPRPPLQQGGWAGCLAGSLELSSPSCHLPLQSISGSCMWVTQQHCSQAQEAAAELKGSRRGS